MARRLDIAIGLVHRPRVIFLDEPTTGLDPEVRAAMWGEIGRLAAQEGLTILLTTHYLEEADHLADRLAILDKGRVVASGTPESLKAELRRRRDRPELRNGKGSRCPTALHGLADWTISSTITPSICGGCRGDRTARSPDRARCTRRGRRRPPSPARPRRRLPPLPRSLVRGRRTIQSR
jgi:hypothetical protein